MAMRHRNYLREAARAREYRRENPDKIRAIKRAWNVVQRDRINAQQRARYYENRTRRLAADKARRRKNRDRILRIEQERRDNNRDRFRANNREWARRNRLRVRAKWWKNRERYATQMFERDIENLPDSVKDMRRVLLALRRWARANSVSLAAGRDLIA